VYLLLVFVVVLLAFSMVQNNRRRKGVAAMQQAIEPGVRVMTTSGIYGIVQDVELDSIVIEISEGVDVRFAKAAVAKVVPDLTDGAFDDDDDHSDHSDLGDSALDDADLHTDLDDADLHAELDAFGARRADRQPGSPSAKDSRADAAEAPGPGRDGHEPGGGPVPST
jgi:preprotein translocase subunit YajC